MVTATAGVWVDAAPEAVAALFGNPEDFEELMPSVETTETAPIPAATEYCMDIRYSLAGIPIGLTAAATHVDLPDRIVYEVSGDVEGTIRWTLEPVDGGTDLCCSLEYEVPDPAEEPLTEDFVERYNQRDVSSLLANIKRVYETSKRPEG